MEKANISKEDLENITPKLTKLIKTGVTQDHLLKITHLIIMKSAFKYKFLNSPLRRMSRLLAEFGLDITIKIEQTPRQAESPETYGSQNPLIAIDPMGKWVAQAGEISPHGAYWIELYELKDNMVFYHHAIEISIKGEVFSFLDNNQIKGLTFNSDGSTLWTSLGTRPNIGPFKTWLVKLNTKDWSYTVFGPVFPYTLLNIVYSRAHYLNLKVIKEGTTEKIIAPMPFLQKTIVFFNHTKPTEVDAWQIDLKVEGHPNFFMRFTDIAVVNN